MAKWITPATAGLPPSASKGQTPVRSRSGATIPADVEILVYYNWATGAYPARPDVPRVTFVGPAAPLLAPSGAAEPGDYWVSDAVPPAAASAIRSASYGEVSTVGNSWPITMPAAVQAGDVLVAFITAGYSATANTIPTPPPGWTRHPVQRRFTNTHAWMFTKTATGNEGGTQVTFTASQANRCAFYCAAASGVLEAPLMVSSAVAATGTVGAATITAPSGSLVFATVFLDLKATTTWTTSLPFGAVDRATIAGGAAGGNNSVAKIVTLNHLGKTVSDAFTWDWSTSLTPARNVVLLTAAFEPKIA